MEQRNAKQNSTYFFDEDSGNGDQQEDRYSMKHVVMVVVAVLLVVSALTLLAILNLIPDRTSEQPVVPVSHSVVDTTGPSFVARDLAASTEEGLVFASMPEEGAVLDPPAFFVLLGVNEPATFQDQTVQFSFGVYRSGDSSFPFVLLRGDRQDDLMAGMRAWERQVSRDLDGFLSSDSSSSGGFETGYVRNALVRENGVVYGFLEGDVVAVTASRAEFETLLLHYRARLE